MPQLEVKAVGAELAVADAPRGLVRSVLADLTRGVLDADGDTYDGPGSVVPREVILSDWNHASAVMSGRPPVGRGRIRADGNRLVFDGRFFMTTEPGRLAFETLRELGEVAEWSWGFEVLDWEPWEQPNTRLIKSIAPFEASPVWRGSGVSTRTEAVKHDEATADLLAIRDRVANERVAAVVRDRQAVLDVMRERSRFDRLGAAAAGGRCDG